MCTCESTKPIIEKWYKILGFDSKYDAEFYQALDTIPVPATTSIMEYPMDCQDGKRNLLFYLYMCEELERKYAEKGISQKILLDTLWDLVRWCNVWSDIKGELYLGEIAWLSNHMAFKLFRLGRLQFAIQKGNATFEKFGKKNGEVFIGIHIPPTDPLLQDACKASIAMARDFFATYFPEVSYTYFTTNTWLLDDTLKEILPEGSNILQFGDLFEKVYTEKSDDILRYVFGWDITRENYQNCPCKSSLAVKVKKAFDDGKDFYITRGIINK